MTPGWLAGLFLILAVVALATLFSGGLVLAQTTPVITVTAVNPSVAEGQPVVFTLTATPPPGSSLMVNFNIAYTGNYVTGVSAGPKDRVIGVGGAYTLTLLTTDDGVIEPDGSVTVTLTDGSGYTLGNPATASVTDNGLPPAQPPVASGTIDAVSVAVGAMRDVDVSGAFTGTVDSYTADSSDDTKATVAVSGSMVTVTGVAEGTATITVTATNTVGSATQTFDVTVTPFVQLPAPENIIAIWTDGKVVMEWDAVTNADNYVVQWKSAGESYDAANRQTMAAVPPDDTVWSATMTAASVTPLLDAEPTTGFASGSGSITTTAFDIDGTSRTKSLI